MPALKHEIFTTVRGPGPVLSDGAGRGERHGQPGRFCTEVKPILEMNCLSCHNPQHAEENGKYRLDTKEEAFKPHKKDQRIVARQAG